MPELAEVETIRRRLHESLRGKKIKEIVADPKDRWMFQFAPLPKVKKALIGAKIKGTGRKGKYFWLELEGRGALIIHLGMTGNISVLKPKQKQHRKVWGEAESEAEPVKTEQGLNKKQTKSLDKKRRPEEEDRQLWFSRLLITFSDGSEMAVIDPRRFGRLWLTEDPWEHSRIKSLGYDPLLDFPNPKELSERLKKRKKAIKSVLLDQNLFAGIGNWLADEILFQARLSPHRKASDLDTAKVKALHKATLEVVRKAVKADADSELYPKTWLFHDRWGKSKVAKTSRGKILHEQIGGRTTAWVPDWQS